MKAAELERLKDLLDRAATDGGGRSDLLDAIDPLLTRALDEEVRPEMSTDQIRRLLGDPHLVVGGLGEATLDWMYPCLPPPEYARDGRTWFVQLSFRNGVLKRTVRRAWTSLV